MVPGDRIEAPLGDIALGPGVTQQTDSEIVPTQAGLLQESRRKNTTFVYVESNFTKYTPQQNDFVIGVVIGSFGEFFKVEISAYSPPVILSMMAFANASKKNRPNLNKGDLVYARVSLVEEYMDTELECFDATTGKEGGFGLLQGGYCVDVRLGFARWLLFNKENALLEKLSSVCQFEIAIGLNGKVWVKCDDTRLTISCAKVISSCQKLPPSEFDNEIKKHFKQ